MWQSLGLNPGNLGSKLRLLLWSEQWSPARLPDLDSEMLDQQGDDGVGGRWTSPVPDLPVLWEESQSPGFPFAICNAHT